ITGGVGVRGSAIGKIHLSVRLTAVIGDVGAGHVAADDKAIGGVRREHRHEGGTSTAGSEFAPTGVCGCRFMVNTWCGTLEASGGEQYDEYTPECPRQVGSGHNRVLGCFKLVFFMRYFAGAIKAGSPSVRCAGRTCSVHPRIQSRPWCAGYRGV